MHQCPQCLWVGLPSQMETDDAGIHLCPNCYVPFSKDWEVV